MAGEAPVRITVTSPRGTQRVRSVSIDAREIRQTSVDALRIASVRDGDELAESEVTRLLDDAEPEAAMNRALRLLGHRERSTAELSDRLSQDGYPSPVVESVIAKLAGYGYVDDARFAEDYVRAKRASGWGRSRIARALSERGVDPQIASPLLESQLPETLEIDRACEAIKTLDVSERKGFEKGLRRLVSRGYSYEVARAALQQQKRDTRDQG
ncbi:MAG: regulatory protein RecX [Anaerosomatales bacterium]|nr:regulatory protein RecX [Coriobacteriia bacterium]